MTSPANDTAALRESTDRLLTAVAKLHDLGEDVVTQSSELPGWTRGHVLAHLSRNADALVNVLAGRPMYESAQARDADIERDAGRPLAAHLEDLRTSAARLDRALAALTDEQWQRTVELRNGVTDLAASLPFRRRIEIELHLIDLGIGHGLADLPGDFTDRELENMARRFSGHRDVPPVELRAEDGRSWRTGRVSGAPDGRGDVAGETDGSPVPVVVTGTPTALVGWLTGRTTGSGLSAEGGVLPTLPPL